MISCPKCGKENQDHYKFCLGCGNELPRDGGGAARPFHPTPPAGVPAVGATPGGGAAMRGPAGPSPFGGAPSPSPFGGGAPSPGGGGFGGAPSPSPFGGGMPMANKPPAAAGPASAAPSAGAIPAVCPSCGSPNPRGNRFCITCGSDVVALAGTPAAGAAPSPVAASGGAPSPFASPGAAAAPSPSPFSAPASAPSPFGGGAPPPVAPTAPSANANAVASRAKLVLIRPDGTEGGSFQLNEGTTVIGRETGPLFASDSYLSPRHATFTVNGMTVSVRDEGALNGVYVRIERQSPVEIRDGDVFRIGQEILRYEAYKPVAPEADGTERQGSQIEGLVGRISLVVGRDVTGNAFPIPITGLFLGRERGDILFPEDGYVSGLHCQLSVEGGRLMLTDTGSSNGTYVRIRGERTIRNSDLLLLGQQLFRLTM